MPEATQVERSVDHLFRRRSGQMVASLTRIFGPRHLDLVEEVVQESFVKALRQWPFHGEPSNPGAWLIQVAKNRAVDILRRRATWDSKRLALEGSLARLSTSWQVDAAFADEIRDDELRMIFTCCDPLLSRDAHVALTLKTVGGLSTAEIARAFLSRDATIAQRLVRAKRQLRDRQVRFEMPAADALPARLDAVLESLYLIFNEGYSASEGEELTRSDLCRQAIRLAELLCDHPLTSAGKVDALAALFLFQASRRPARTDSDGSIVLLAEQDRSVWDHEMRRRGLEHLARSATGSVLSRYHLEAEIASCHALAASWETTDWQQILVAYDALLELNPSPVTAVNRAVALAEIAGPEPALGEIGALAGNPALSAYYPYHLARGDLLSRLGRSGEAAAAYRRALDLVTSVPVRMVLERRLADTRPV